MREACFDCGSIMKEHQTKIEGVLSDCLKCTKCGDIVFTEKQVLESARQIDMKRLKEKYTKRPVKIGNGYGFLMPQEVVRAFKLADKGTEANITFDKSKNKIEITVL